MLHCESATYVPPLAVTSLMSPQTSFKVTKCGREEEGKYSQHCSPYSNPAAGYPYAAHWFKQASTVLFVVQSNSYGNTLSPFPGSLFDEGHVRYDHSQKAGSPTQDIPGIAMIREDSYSEL